MNVQDAMAIQFNSLVQFQGGEIGLVIRFWSNTQSLGVQVPGEEQIREVKFASLEDLGEGMYACVPDSSQEGAKR